MAPAKKAAAAMPDAPKKPITTTTTNTTSKTSPPTTKPTRTPARTAAHNLSIILNTTLLATLLTAPVTFPNATRAALHAAHADIAAWHHSVAAVRSDPAAVARAQFDNLLTWVGDITSPGLSAQQRQWAQEESDDSYNNKKLMVAPTVALDKQAGSIYTKAKTGDKEWRREKDGSEAAKPKGTKESASGEPQPVGDIIADILASFQKNKDGKAPAAAAGQKAKKSAGSAGSSLTKEQQNIADTVGALVGLFGKAITDNTKPAAADTVKPKLEKKLEATNDKKSTPPGIAKKRDNNDADTEEVPVAAVAAEVFTEEIKVDTTDAETVVVVEETHQVEIKQAKPAAGAAGSNPAEAFGDLLGLLGKLSSPGGIPKKSASSSSSTSSSSSSSRSATKGGDSAADLIGLLGTLGSALGNGNNKQGAATAGGGGAADLLGLLGSAMGNANGKKGGAGGGAADLIGLLGALAGNAGSAGGTTSGRTGATGGNTGPANPLAGLDIGTTVKMMRMMSAFQGISKTVSGDQASGTREGVDGARAGSGGGGGGGAGDMADMLSAGMDAFNFLGKVMANMPTPGEREARRRGNTIGDEV